MGASNSQEQSASNARHAESTKRGIGRLFVLSGERGQVTAERLEDCARDLDKTRADLKELTDLADKQQERATVTSRQTKWVALLLIFLVAGLTAMVLGFVFAHALRRKGYYRS